MPALLPAVHGAAGASTFGALHRAKSSERGAARQSPAERCGRGTDPFPAAALGRVRARGAREEVILLGLTPRWLGMSGPVLALDVKPHLRPRGVKSHRG